MRNGNNPINIPHSSCNGPAIGNIIVRENRTKISQRRVKFHVILSRAIILFTDTTRVIGEDPGEINRLMDNKVWEGRWVIPSSLPAIVIWETSNNLPHWNSSVIYASRIDKQTKRNNISARLCVREADLWVIILGERMITFEVPLSHRERNNGVVHRRKEKKKKKESAWFNPSAYLTYTRIIYIPPTWNISPAGKLRDSRVKN